MSSAQPTEPGALDGRGLAVALVATAVAAFLGTLVLSDDPDMFHHLAMGRELLRSGFPSTEPFLFPHRGEPSGAPSYWLGSVAIYAWHATFGDAGLSVLPAAVGALLAVLLVLDSTPRHGRHGWMTLAAAAAPVALAIETYRYRAVARTEIFSAAMLALTMWAIRRHEDGRSRALLALPLVALLWTNLHPATAVGLVPLALFVLSGAVERIVRGAIHRGPGAAPSWRAIGIATGVLVAMAAASAVTPAAENPVFGAVRFALAALRLGSGGASDPALSNVVRFVGEMQGGGAALFRTPVGALIALAALSFVLRARALRLREVLTVAAFAVLPFQAVRFAVFFAIVAAPVTGRNLGETVSALPARLREVPVRASAALALAAAALASLPLGMLAPHIRFGAGLAHGVFPVRGTEYLRTVGFDGRLFNSFGFGGYLEWAGLAPFQDGRGGTFPADTPAAIAGPTNWPLFVPLDERYRFDALLVTYPAGDPRSGAPAGVFDPVPGVWALVAFDDAALLYLRRDGKYAAAAARDEFRQVTPSHPGLALPPTDPGGVLAELRRSVVEAPGCFRCRYWLGQVALAAGRPEESLSAALPVIERTRGAEREAFEAMAATAAEQLRGGGRLGGRRGQASGERPTPTRTR